MRDFRVASSLNTIVLQIPFVACHFILVGCMGCVPSCLPAACHNGRKVHASVQSPSACVFARSDANRKHVCVCVLLHVQGKYLAADGGPPEARLNKYKGRYAEAESRSEDLAERKPA